MLFFAREYFTPVSSPAALGLTPGATAPHAEQARTATAQHAGRKGRAVRRRPTVAAATTELDPIPNAEKNGKNASNSIPERRRRRRSFSMAMARRSGGAGRSPRERKKRCKGGRSGVGRAAYFYAQNRPICQLLGDQELGWETIRDYFFDFSQKIKDGEEK